jgi:hypothetical protein
MARWDEILKKVQMNLHDGGAERVVESVILRELTRVELEVAAEGCALEDDAVIVLEAGRKVYDLDVNVHKLVEIFEPAGWEKELTVLESAGEYKREARNEWLSSTQPLYALVWNRRLRLHPAPTVSGEEIGLFVYRLPETAAAENADPELDTVWDDVLEYGGTARVIDMLRNKDKTIDPGTWWAKYAERMASVKERVQRHTAKGVRHAGSFTRALNF